MESTHAFQEGVEVKVSHFFAEHVFTPSATEVEGRIEPNLSIEFPMPVFLQSESRLNPSETLLLVCFFS